MVVTRDHHAEVSMMVTDHDHHTAGKFQGFPASTGQRRLIRRCSRARGEKRRLSHSLSGLLCCMLGPCTVAGRAGTASCILHLRLPLNLPPSHHGRAVHASSCMPMQAVISHHRPCGRSRSPWPHGPLCSITRAAAALDCCARLRGPALLAPPSVQLQPASSCCCRGRRRARPFRASSADGDDEAS